MKRTAFILITLFAAFSSSSSQETEFYLSSNGLIYNNATMDRLKFIVDSMQLKFRQCTLHTRYYSIKQTTGHAIKLDTGDVHAALVDIYNNISYQDFVKKYPLAVIDSSILITETPDEGYEGREFISYENRMETGNTCDGINIVKECVGSTYDFVSRIVGNNNNWVFKYIKPGEYPKHQLEAFYLVRPAATQLIPESYCRNILYADCMIDTTTDVILPDARSSSIEMMFIDDTAVGKKHQLFLRYLKRQTLNVANKYHVKEPVDYPERYFFNDSLRLVYIKDSLSKRPAYKTLLKNAIEEWRKGGTIPDEELEYHTKLFYSPREALLMKRKRLVMGRCSRDPGPRIHAMNIAQLAAETADWQVFLRAHLDIMNDNLQRMINSNFAQKTRKTYIRELEELDLDIQDLLIGISLAISNPAAKHYTGSNDRLGRAFAETKNRALFEQKVLGMIADGQLDDFNRLILHYLFLSYCYYLPEKQDRLAAAEKLEIADQQLPAYLRAKITIDKPSIEEGADAPYNPIPWHITSVWLLL